MTDDNKEEDLKIEIEGEESSAEPSQKDDLAEDKVAVEVLDDTPEADRKHKRRPEGQEPDVPNDEEIASYSEAVQKRIKKLRYEFHEERRAKEEYQRQLDEATRVAQQAFKAHEELRKRYTQGEKVLVNEAKSRIDSDLARARDLYKRAFEAGDSEKLAEAQEVIARLASEKRDVETYRPQEPPPLQAPPPRQAPEDPKVRDWVGKNPWFMQDRDMTNYALLVDERLKRQGVDPRSDDYYRRLDESLRKEFPGRFKEEVSSSAAPVSEQPRKQGTVVAPASRTQANSPRRITLTKSQVELARRLGITPEGYAKQLLALKGNN